MLEPQLVQFREITFRLLGKTRDELTTCSTRSIADGPRLVLEADNEGSEERVDMGANSVLLNLGSELGDTMTGRFTDSVVIRFRLQHIVLDNGGDVLGYERSTLVSDVGFPRFVRVQPNSRSHIVSVQAQGRQDAFKVLSSHIHGMGKELTSSRARSYGIESVHREC